jgi:site-specific recombinase XerC
MARHGVSMLVLQELLGHSSLKMVANYIRLSLTYITEEYDKGVAKMEKQFQL